MYKILFCLHLFLSFVSMAQESVRNEDNIKQENNITAEDNLLLKEYKTKGVIGIKHDNVVIANRTYDDIYGIYADNTTTLLKRRLLSKSTNKEEKKSKKHHKHGAHKKHDKHHGHHHHEAEGGEKGSESNGDSKGPTFDNVAFSDNGNQTTRPDNYDGGEDYEDLNKKIKKYVYSENSSKKKKNDSNISKRIYKENGKLNKNTKTTLEFKSKQELEETAKQETVGELIKPDGSEKENSYTQEELVPIVKEEVKNNIPKNEVVEEVSVKQNIEEPVQIVKEEVKNNIPKNEVVEEVSVKQNIAPKEEMKNIAIDDNIEKKAPIINKPELENINENIKNPEAAIKDNKIKIINPKSLNATKKYAICYRTDDRGHIYASKITPAEKNKINNITGIPITLSIQDINHETDGKIGSANRPMMVLKEDINHDNIDATKISNIINDIYHNNKVSYNTQNSVINISGSGNKSITGITHTIATSSNIETAATFEHTFLSNTGADITADTNKIYITPQAKKILDAYQDANKENIGNNNIKLNESKDEITICYISNNSEQGKKTIQRSAITEETNHEAIKNIIQPQKRRGSI